MTTNEIHVELSYLGYKASLWRSIKGLIRESKSKLYSVSQSPLILLKEE